MDKLTRFGVSIETDLIEAFDTLITEKGYKNRSEVIRDLIRADLRQKRYEDKNTIAYGNITIVYDHHVPELTKKITQIQHDYGEYINSSTHLHISHHDCMEIIIVKGQIKILEKIANLLASIKGINAGNLNLAI